MRKVDRLTFALHESYIIFKLVCINWHVKLLYFREILETSKSNDRDDILIPGKALGVDDVEDAGSVELTVSHEDFL